ncbi:MAG: sigma-70 family RNA polymerase sigma factor [Armatimonadetes bacterium]|nr:sigma-70 family RNA polymerase sigma factor [Armatimonadota bacterium]
MASHKQLDTATEQVLVEKCRRQNYEAFGQLVDAYQSRVLGFVRGMVHNSEEALDITQEVFIKAFQAFGRFDGRSSLRTWLFRIAYNLCVDENPGKCRINGSILRSLSWMPNSLGTSIVGLKP